MASQEQQFALTPTTKKAFDTARAKQNKALDMLRMPPPPPRTRTEASNDKENKSFLTAKTNHAAHTATTANSPVDIAASKLSRPLKRPTLTRSPATPRPVFGSVSQMNQNQLSRTTKPKPFQQKLSEASLTPPKKPVTTPSAANSNNNSNKMSPSRIGAAGARSVVESKFELAKRDHEIETLKQLLDTEHKKKSALEMLVESRNKFILRIGTE
ncbi:hypothetical protein HK100_004994 [Physocladia obscura]|uniref:Uncharacterized protein n=1 Tax=Physocladia obscura TaxID=109957 RepID=A0AAD5STR2_9FUNG|nr:hypothetical protein HK100_004994 [Physocladia obscura]